LASQLAGIAPSYSLRRTIMCGIAGILGRVTDANRAALARISNALAHRGPDGHGEWFSSITAANEPGCLLAHRRLSILDLSSAANQPMVDPIGGQAIVFNGEIYNFSELKRYLEAQGQRFQSSGDTAVLLRLLAIEGYQAIRKLRGMFAFGLWDTLHRRLVLTRDALGIKPLYICRNPDRKGDWSLIFASELRAILASGLVTRRTLDPRSVASVVWNGYVMGSNTMVQGIELLSPGEVRVFDAQAIELHSETYWQMPGAKQDGTVDENAARAAVIDSVQRHLVSDVPLGMFFSGGIDSSAVANLAQRHSGTPLTTFTLAFDEGDLSESEHARRVARAIGTNHHEAILTESEFVRALDTALGTLDQPTFDGLNSYYMSKAFHEAGFTVALVGTGGDELFGGYASFRDLPRLQHFNNCVRWVPKSARRSAACAVAAAAQGFAGGGSMPPQTRWAKLPYMVDNVNDPLALCQLAYALFLPDFQADLMSNLTSLNGSMVNGLPKSILGRLQREIRGRSLLSAISVMETRCFLGERLLRDSDAASMAVSLELRLPLVDSVLLDCIHRLPDKQRFSPVGTKSLLRRIGLEGLDPALFARPKRGFVLPYDAWIRRNLGKAMDDTMRDERLAASAGLNGRAVARLWKGYRDGARGLYWSRVWALYVLIRWCQQHRVLL